MPTRPVWILTSFAVAAGYVLLDWFLIAPMDSFASIYSVFDASSLHYSAIQWARGLPLLTRDFNFTGEPAHAYHGLFVRLLGEAATSVKAGISVGSAVYGAVALLVLARITQKPYLAALLALILWGALSGFALGFGNGYPSYYVFTLSAACFWLLLRLAAESRPEARRRGIFCLGFLVGTAYMFKYELGLVVICTSALTLTAPFFTFPLFCLFAGAFSLLTVAAFRFHAFFLGLAPLACVLFALFRSRAPARALPPTWRQSTALFLGGIGVAILPWIAHLASQAGMRAALMQYFPVHMVGFHKDAMVAHQIRDYSPWERIADHFELYLSPDGFGTSLVLTLFALLAFYILPKRSPRAALGAGLALFLGGGAIVAWLRLIPIAFTAQILPFFPIYVAGFLWRRPELRDDRLFLTLLLFASGMQAIYLRENFNAVYTAWGLCLPSLALALYLLRSYFASWRPFAAPIAKHEAAYLLLGAPLFAHLLFGCLFEMNLRTASETRFTRGRNYVVSRALGIAGPAEVVARIDALQEFFRKNLKPEETIFAFSGIRMAYTLADRPTPTNLRMPYFLTVDPESDARLAEALASEGEKIRYVVLTEVETPRFSGRAVRLNNPRTNAWFEANYVPKQVFNPVVVFERKPSSASTAGGR